MKNGSTWKRSNRWWRETGPTSVTFSRSGVGSSAAVLEIAVPCQKVAIRFPVLNRLSSALIDTGQNQEALTILKHLSGVVPWTIQPPTLRWVQVYLRLKDFKQAKEAYEESLQINPFD